MCRRQVKNMPNIAIYAGHGGSDSGVTDNVSRLKEKNFTLVLANAVTVILRNFGYSVVNNHTTDTARNITRDAKLANDKNADAVVEIHLNGNSGKPQSGSEAYVSIRDAALWGGKAKTLAQAILNHLSEIDFHNRGVFTSVTASGIDTLGILRLTNMPTVLLEVAFINNPQDMSHLDIETVSAAIAGGIKQVFPVG